MEWKNEPLGEIVFMTSGGTPSRKIAEYYTNGSIPWVRSGELENEAIRDTEIKITQAGLENSSAKIFPKGTLLIALYGATIGKLAYLDIDACTNQAVCGIFENQKVSLKYLYYYLLFHRPDLVKQGIGGAQPNISQTILKKLAVHYPVDKAEQECIVARIEELFSELDNGVETLKTVKTLILKYRRSVIKYELSRNYSDCIWTETTIANVCDCLDFMRRPVNKKSRESAVGLYPYYGANGETGRIDDYIFDEELVLICEDETFTGRIKPFSYIIHGKSWVNNHAHILRGKQGVLSNKYLNYLLSYYPFLPLVTGTTGRKKLTQSTLMNIPIRICDYSTQQIVVREIESRLSVCDKIEQTVDTALQQAEALRQSILKQAFEVQR